MKYVATFMLCIVASLFIQVNEVASHKTIEMIPDEAIRLRILANSNETRDQEIKLIVRDAVSLYVSELVHEIDDINDARYMINQHIDKIENIIESTLRNEGVHHEFSLSFRKNVPFPKKMYDNYLYPEGLYEAILITIGDGEGDNWWCVLFPPLCFVEFSTKEKEELEETNDVHQENEQEQSENNAENDEKEEKPIISFFTLEWLGL